MSETETDDILLRSRQFRVEREADWKRLEHLLEKVADNSADALTNEEMIALPRLYRSTLSALSVARATSLDQGVIRYLESLSTRAYFFIYGPRARFRDLVLGFLRGGWPRAVRGIWRETLVAALITVAAAAVAYGLTINDPSWFYSFVDEGLAAGRTPAASTETLRRVLYGEQEVSGLSVFSTFLFTHNARIALFAFALGFAFCLPTALLLAYNGCTLGAFLALYAGRGLGFELGGWLLVHGVTELFAVILAGAAGLKIGWALAHPGEMTRLASAAKAGRPATLVLVGVVIMLLIAGLLEGVARQLITDDYLRYAIAGGTALFWGAYFYSGGLKEAQYG